MPSSAILLHDADDGLVRFHHALGGDPADVLHGRVRVRRNDPFPVMKLLLMQIHLITEDAGFDGGRDLGGAGRLCAVAERAGDHGDRVHEGMRDNGFVAAQNEAGTLYKISLQNVNGADS